MSVKYSEELVLTALTRVKSQQPGTNSHT